MNIFRRLFGKDETCLPRCSLRNAQVYYSAKGILIAATLWDKLGFEGGGEPMALLSSDANVAAIGGHVVRSVQASRWEANEEQFQRSTLAMFGLAGLSDWNGLEKAWDHICVSMELGQETVTIYPHHRYKTGGYGSVEGDPVYRCRLLPEEVGPIVRKIVDGGPQNIIFTAEDEELEQASVQAESPGEQPLLPEPAFTVGDRVIDLWGNEGTVTHIDAAAEQGLGKIVVRFDNGSTQTLMLMASGLKHVTQPHSF